MVSLTVYSVVIFSRRYLDSNRINVKTVIVLLAVYWSIWTSSYNTLNTCIKVQHIFKWSLHNKKKKNNQRILLSFFTSIRSFIHPVHPSIHPSFLMRMRHQWTWSDKAKSHDWGGSLRMFFSSFSSFPPLPISLSTSLPVSPAHPSPVARISRPMLTNFPPFETSPVLTSPSPILKLRLGFYKNNWTHSIPHIKKRSIKPTIRCVPVVIKGLISCACVRRMYVTLLCILVTFPLNIYFSYDPFVNLQNSQHKASLLYLDNTEEIRRVKFNFVHYTQTLIIMPLVGE